MPPQRVGFLHRLVLKRAVADPGEGPGGPVPLTPLISTPKWGPKGRTKCLLRPAPRLSQGLDDRAPPYLEVWKGIVLAHSGPESGMVFEETTGLVNRNGKGEEVNFKGKVKLLFLPRTSNFFLSVYGPNAGKCISASGTQPAWWSWLLNNTLGGFTSFWLGSVKEKTARLAPKGVFQKFLQNFQELIRCTWNTTIAREFFTSDKMTYLSYLCQKDGRQRYRQCFHLTWTGLTSCSCHWSSTNQSNHVTNATFKHMFLIRETICNKLKVAWTYPSPKPTFCPKWEVSVNVGLGEG